MINPTEPVQDDSEGNYTIHIDALRSQMAKGLIEGDRQCPNFPCHHPDQNCTFCFCPLYPCEDPALGEFVTSRRTGGKVWSCQRCLWIHRDDVASSLFQIMPDIGPGGLDLPTRRKLKAQLERKHAKRAKAIMVLGATSGAGKSLLVTALCRAFRNRGLTVAPFKSQNMSLNSMVTDRGEEIARIQELQARAAGTRPRGELNPILLKPKGGVTSQIIVEGRPYRDTTVQEYYSKFVPDEAPAIIARNLEHLMGSNDVVVIEGAGSPAEINLRGRDVANMYVAKLVHADCLLVVNIDWGGAFAYAVGTLSLLDDEERQLFKGVIINNMCPGGGSLGPAVDIIEKITGVPVLAVMPHMPSLYLPVEDSMDLSLREEGNGHTVVAVVRLPMISNFTDFDALGLEEGVCVVYAQEPSELDGASAIIIPGTKNTVHDLEWLRESGMAKAILVRAGDLPILGICGGYQMLGRMIVDDHGLEGDVSAKIDGLGLLRAVTHFDSYDKRTMQVIGKLAAAGGAVRGYEIHMGRTEGSDAPPLFIMDPDGRPEGMYDKDRMVMGTYLHGAFDLPAFRRFFLSLVKNPVAGDAVVMDHDSAVDGSLRRLAEEIEKHLDLDALLGGDQDGA
ncbi:MAG: cobyric acid synthase [Methanomassiliicoccales archaeon]|nr:cobyric acid synthase [Methanomassiliicoccales archaeon]